MSSEKKDISSERVSIIKYDDLYLNILRDIRDMNVLSYYQLYFMRELPMDRLINIIEVYNMVMRNVNEII